jgi:hypothetical protein
VKCLTCHIEIGSYQFTSAAEVRVVSGWKNPGDYAAITLPRRLSFKGQSVSDLLKPGDAVSIRLGYDSVRPPLRFTGQLSSLSPDTPMVVTAEDAVYPLKRNSVSKAWKQVALAELLAFIAPSVEIDCPDMQLGEFRIDRATSARVLVELQKTFGLYSYFRDSKLVCGFAYFKQGQRVKLDMQRDIASSSLNQVGGAERRIKVTAINIERDGKKTTAIGGSPDGEERTLHFTGLTPERLKETAEAEAQRLTALGMDGSISALGYIEVSHGDIVELVDSLRPERNGSWLVDQVTHLWGMGGYRKEIQLGRRV